MQAHQYTTILEAATHAPSGDNSQPWCFTIAGDEISIYHRKGQDKSLYDFKQRGSYIAHGALIENILIASGSYGCHGEVETFPGEADCTAKITFTRVPQREDPLAPFITIRTTNRKPYDNKPLSQEQREELTESVKAFPGVSFTMKEEKADIAALAHAVSLNEQLVMENRTLHDCLFSVIRWSKQEERSTSGIYIKTMELPAPAIPVFKIARFWQCLRLLNLLGFSKTARKRNAKKYASSSGIGALILTSSEDTEYLNAGRAFQRLWLTATKLGLSIQPITAIPYLAMFLSDGDNATVFSEEHRACIMDEYRTITDIFAVTPKQHVAMLFRIGFGGEPSAHSYKLPPLILNAS